MNDIFINNCFCGCKASLVKNSVVYGHGDFGTEIYVKSECGVSGKHFTTYEMSEPIASLEAIRFWNEHFQPLE